MLKSSPLAGIGGTGNPAGSPPAPLNGQGLLGRVSASGFHSLPRNGITQEAVRLINGNVNRTVPVARVSGPGSGLHLDLTHSSEDEPLLGLQVEPVHRRL